MTKGQEAAKNDNGRSAKTPRAYPSKSQKDGDVLGERSRRSPEEDGSLIVANAYKEADRIIAEAKAKAKDIAGGAGTPDANVSRRLHDLTKPSALTERSYEQIDDVLAQTKQCLAKIAKSDQSTIDKLTDLVVQLEYWVESLVVDSLKLKGLERWLQGTTELAKKLRAELDSK